MKPPVPRFVVVLELDGNALAGGTVQLIINFHSDGCREELPVVLSDHLVARKPVQLFSFFIDIRNPPVCIERDKTIRYAFEHVYDFVTSSFCLGAEKTFTLDRSPACQRHPN